MAGIAGIVLRDGGPGAARLVEQMLAQLAHRGGEPAVIDRGWVALGATRSEGRGSPDDGALQTARWAAVAEARFDAPGSAPTGLGTVVEDLAVVGTSALQRVLGDFAFAVAIDGTLTLARDHVGIRQLYYYCDEHLMAFATELKALFAIPQVPRRVNRRRVVDYLVDAWLDWDATLYEGIDAVPPAHTVEVRPGCTPVVRRYWAPDPDRVAPEASLKEHAATFRAIFLEAVRSRLPGEGEVAALLSGGLDSSSIICTARSLLAPAGRDITTLSAIFSDVPSADESGFIQHVTMLPGVRPIFFEPASVGALHDFEGTAWGADEPYWPGTAIQALGYRLAAEAGCGVLLDGTGGDDVVSHGNAAIPEFIARGRLLRAAGAMRALHLEFGASYPALLRHWGVGPFVPQRLRALRQHRRRHLPGAPLMPMRPEVVREVNLTERLLLDDERPPRLERQRHLGELVVPLDPVAFGAQDRLAARHRVVPRYPFYDRRLMEFCLSLPAEAKVAGGYTRAVLREAMRGLLPEPIRTRRGKVTIAPAVARACRQYDTAMLAEMVSHPGSLADFVEIPALADTVDRFLAGTDAELSTVLRAAVTWRWLRRQAS